MKITFLRHAHAEPDRDDINRVLSQKGLEQALKLKKMLGNHKYDLVIYSVAKRTLETAEAICYGQSDLISNRFIALSGLYLPESQEDINLVSKAIMLLPNHAPREILAKYKSDAWERYTMQAYQEILSILKQHRDLTNVLIVGHGTILNLVAAKFVTDVENLLARYLGHLEGFSLEVDID